MAFRRANRGFATAVKSARRARNQSYLTGPRVA
jgi:hypothetical protein